MISSVLSSGGKKAPEIHAPLMLAPSRRAFEKSMPRKSAALK
jgi:hypothetical protein